MVELEELYESMSRRVNALGIAKGSYTGGIKKFSCKENFGKILKVSHFSLGFSLNKNNTENKHFQRVLLDFSGPRLGKL